MNDISVSIENIVPKLSKHIYIQPFDRGTYLIQQTQFDYNLKVGTLTHSLLNLIDGNRTLSDIKMLLRNKNAVNINENEIHKILYDKLADYGIIESEKKVKRKIKANYLYLRFTLFPERYVFKVSHIFSFLYSPKIFYSLFLTLLLFISFLVYNTNLGKLSSSFSIDAALYFPFIMIINLLFHELGHATACRKFGAKHGEIGFGFYLFTPVLYADVSDAWKLKPSQRIIIDLAGIYMELVFCLLLGIYFLITQNSLFLLFIILILINSYKNLNPFLRYDGYWALSDLIKVPNLRKESSEKCVNLFKWALGKDRLKVKTVLDYFLVLYGGISWSFIFIFVFIIISYYHKELIEFPFILYETISNVIENYTLINASWLKKQFSPIMLPALFYFMIGRIVYRILKNNKKNISTFF